jgi:RHS repeat-associated protein
MKKMFKTIFKKMKKIIIYIFFLMMGLVAKAQTQIVILYYDYDMDGIGTGTSQTFQAPGPPTGPGTNWSFYTGDLCDINPNIKNIAPLPGFYYIDKDGDKYGDRDPYNTSYGCPNLLGNFPYPPDPNYVTNSNDCDDNNPELNSTVTWSQDIYGNGFIIPYQNQGCSPPPNCSDCVLPGTYGYGLYNWTRSATYDLKGNVTSSSRTYFDGLGKPNLSLSKDFVKNIVWGTETTYDNFGRPDKTSFPAPAPMRNSFFAPIMETSFQKISLLNPTYQTGNPAASITITTPVTTSQNFKVIENITATSVVNNNLTVNFEANQIRLLPGFNAGNGFSVKAIPLPSAATAVLQNYYSDSNTIETYQATATQPYSQTNYDTLNPGNVISVVGGNKINGEWKTGFSYTFPAAQEMYYVYGQDYYDGAVTAGKEEVITKFYKSVGVDANGVENVSFSDGEGKTLASARSGGAASYPVVSLIGTQGFVDVHIPAGINSGQISLIGGASLYKVYDLKTGLLTTSLTGGNAYRIEALTPPTIDPKSYITAGAPTYDAGALGITYAVNYYDYAVNVYNKTGQLIKSIQPNGYVASATVVAQPAHMASGATAFISTYVYNDQGQLKEATSPDEGTSKFAYRQDGQIRYSQSALQADTKVSYTNYDDYGRPVESGVITSIAGIWALAAANADVKTLIAGTRSEQTFTVYDYPENNTVTSVPLPTNLTLSSVLANAGISTANYVQNNLSGNVAITYAKPAATVSAITWYSYDIYGRSEWMVQYNEGISAKTIHYEYDYKGNVKKVLFQKEKPAERFAHQYTYDANSVLTKVETSTDNTTFITHADYTYYATGELKRTNIAQGAQGLDYVYTLGGQLKSINHPSLEQAKDPGGDANDVFGLTLDYYTGDYLRTGRNITTSPSITNDYNGNIKAARFANKGVAADFTAGIANQKAYTYNYDRNNWLKEATFGTTNNTAAITPSSAYAENNLAYDANGNIKTLQRTSDTGAVTDRLVYNYTNTGKNQLNSVTEQAAVTPDPNDIENQAPNNYIYDAIGQMTSNVKENLTYIYNTQGLVTEVRKAGNPVVKFFYNERGQRVKKESYSTTAPLTREYYVLDIAGNTMAIYRETTGIANTITQTELPIYGLSRLGVYNRTGTATNDYMTYQITDHLGNVRAIIKKIVNDTTVLIASYADYYPFGEQLPGRNSMSGYRYAFQGQELDGETGMEAFQLRLWDGRIGRWLSPDPYGQYASPYLGMGNNPIGMIDPDGGYTNAIFAFFGWIGRGFEGSIEHTGRGGNKEYAILVEGKTVNDGDPSIGLLNSVYPDQRYYGKSELGAQVFVIPGSWGGITLPTFDGGGVIFASSSKRGLIQHERGHIEQIRELGGLGYLKDVGFPSVYNTLENRLEEKLYGKTLFSVDHEEFYTETDANIKAFWLYGGDFKHRERSPGVRPYNPLIGKVSELTAFQRLKVYTRYEEYHQAMKYRREINASNTFHY